jgi:hypothetical protein
MAGGVTVGMTTANGPSFDFDSYVVTSSDGLTWVERYQAPGTILNCCRWRWSLGSGRIGKGQ